MHRNYFCQESQHGGQCDGRFQGTRYFTAAPKSSIFTTAECLLPYRFTEKKKRVHSQHKLAQNSMLCQGKSSYFPQSYSQAVTKNNISKLIDPDTARSEQINFLPASNNDQEHLGKTCTGENCVSSENRIDISDQLGRF